MNEGQHDTDDQADRLATKVRLLVQPRILPSAAWPCPSSSDLSYHSLEDGLSLDEHLATVTQCVASVLGPRVHLTSPTARPSVNKRRRTDDSDGETNGCDGEEGRTGLCLLLCVDVHTADGSLLEPILAGALHLLSTVQLPASVVLAPLPSLTARSYALVASTLLADPTADELAASQGLLTIIVGPSDVLVASSFVPLANQGACATSVPATLSPSLLATAIAAARR